MISKFNEKGKQWYQNVNNKIMDWLPVVLHFHFEYSGKITMHMYGTSQFVKHPFFKSTFCETIFFAVGFRLQ